MMAWAASLLNPGRSYIAHHVPALTVDGERGVSLLGENNLLRHVGDGLDGKAKRSMQRGRDFLYTRGAGESR